MEIEKKEEKSEELEDNFIPLSVMRKDKFKVDMLTNRYPMVQSRESMERIENYQGLLKPTPIEVELRGQLPPFEMSFDLPKFIPTEKELEKENYELMDHILDRDIFRKHIPKQAVLDKFIKSLKEKVIHEYNIYLLHLKN